MQQTSTKQIVIVTAGSRGDVQPFVALGRGLRQRGYQVRLLAPAVFKPLVERHSLQFGELEGDVQGMLQSELGMSLLETGRNPLTLGRKMGELAKPVAMRATEQAWAASQDADAMILGGVGAWLGLPVAEKLGVPFMTCYLQPLLPGREFFSPLLPPPAVPLPGWLNKRATSLSLNLFWSVIAETINTLRVERFGLPKLPRWNPFKAYIERQDPLLLGFSPSVIGHSADWHRQIHVTGYWFLDDADLFEPDAALKAFLAAGERPVYVGFGSMTSRDPVETSGLIVAALKQAGQRGVLLSGWGGLSAETLPDSVHLIRSTSHQWLLPQMAAVVHHGGAGTTAAGLRSGLPSVVVPFFGDQPFWADRVHKLGVGPQPIPRQALSAEKLARAIDRAVTDRAMRQQAATLGATIDAEAGVANAVRVLEQTILA